MSCRLVDGVAVPDAVGGHRALDFCNTRAGWGAPQPREYLTGARALGVWVREAGLLDAAQVAPLVGGHLAAGTERAALERVWLLREALYACLVGRATPAQWRVLEAEAAAARAASRLVAVAGGDRARTVGAQDRPSPAGGRAAWVLGVLPLAPLDHAVLAIAAAADQFVTSPLAGCVAACPGAGCGWLFADPRRRRRWCSMAVCGNRAKARRHADRRGSVSAGPALRSAQGQWGVPAGARPGLLAAVVAGVGAEPGGQQASQQKDH